MNAPTRERNREIPFQISIVVYILCITFLFCVFWWQPCIHKLQKSKHKCCLWFICLHKGKRILIIKQNIFYKHRHKFFEPSKRAVLSTHSESSIKRFLHIYIQAYPQICLKKCSVLRGLGLKKTKKIRPFTKIQTPTFFTFE